MDLRDSQGQEAVQEIVNYPVEPLDLSDLPRFQFKIPNVGKSLFLALPEILILVFLNLILFTVAWISFLRADVR